MLTALHLPGASGTHCSFSRKAPEEAVWALGFVRFLFLSLSSRSEPSVRHPHQGCQRWRPRRRIVRNGLATSGSGITLL